MKLKNIVQIVSLLIVLLSTSTSIFASGELYDVNSPEVKEITEEFSMDGHEYHDLGTCQTKQRYYDDIAELLNEGKTKQEILDYYYSMYGEEGLRAPKKEGFSLTAWATPFVVLGIAGFALILGLKNIIHKPKDQFFIEEKEDDIESEIINNVIDEERKKYY